MLESVEVHLIAVRYSVCLVCEKFYFPDNPKLKCIGVNCRCQNFLKAEPSSSIALQLFMSFGQFCM